jgi:hypothetical protein
LFIAASIGGEVFITIGAYVIGDGSMVKVFGFVMR